MTLTVIKDYEITDAEWLNQLHVEFERKKAYGEMVIKYERGGIVFIKKTDTLKKPKQQDN